MVDPDCVSWAELLGAASVRVSCWFCDDVEGDELWEVDGDAEVCCCDVVASLVVEALEAAAQLVGDALVKLVDVDEVLGVDTVEKPLPLPLPLAVEERLLVLLVVLLAPPPLLFPGMLVLELDPLPLVLPPLPLAVPVLDPPEVVVPVLAPPLTPPPLFPVVVVIDPSVPVVEDPSALRWRNLYNAPSLFSRTPASAGATGTFDAATKSELEWPLLS